MGGSGVNLPARCCDQLREFVETLYRFLRRTRLDPESLCDDLPKGVPLLQDGHKPMLHMERDQPLEIVKGVRPVDLLQLAWTNLQEPADAGLEVES